jgi:hypothetical protein
MAPELKLGIGVVFVSLMMLPVRLREDKDGKTLKLCQFDMQKWTQICAPDEENLQYSNISSIKALVAVLHSKARLGTVYASEIIIHALPIHPDYCNWRDHS